MTLLLSWLGKDSRKISSIYLASDSRISWPNEINFDYGRKIFGCKKYPVIIGYCGDVLFPSIVLNQIVELADLGLLFSINSSNETRFNSFFSILKQAFDKYPSHISGVFANTIEILFVSRCKEIDFFCRKIKWVKEDNSWVVDEIPFTDFSDKLFVLGSGKVEFENKFKLYLNSNNARTSRVIFQCFCDTLFNINDNYCGGPPQLIGLYNKFNSIFFGVIYDDKRYLNGLPIDDLSNFNFVEWRNELFEICDGLTKRIKFNTQKQPNNI